ncbi:hypothetical protein Hanom_Chr12g01130741 [Helianthus anomalus]
MTGCHCQVYLTDRAMHARVCSRLCRFPLAPFAWVTVLSQERCCCSYRSYLWRWKELQFLLPMSTGDHNEDSEEMSVELPPLKWPRATFDGLTQNLRFPGSWGAIYPEEG